MLERISYYLYAMLELQQKYVSITFMALKKAVLVKSVNQDLSSFFSAMQFEYELPEMQRLWDFYQLPESMDLS